MINYYLAQMLIKDNILEAEKERLINKANRSNQIRNRKQFIKFAYRFRLIQPRESAQENEPIVLVL